MKNLKQIPDNLSFYRHRKLRVGFSGGSDSTALLLLLLQWGFAPEQLECVHFDHGLRGEASCADAGWCREFCAELKVKITVVELKLLEQQFSGSLEDNARRARMQWYMLNDDSSPVVLAHHADDADETLLLKLARGGNVSALNSLRFERRIGKLLLLRPLLPWRKRELEDFLRQQNVTLWRHDASNDENCFHRNYLRNKLLKDWQSYHAALRDGLQRSRAALADDADFIEQAAAEKLSSLGNSIPENTSVDFWRALHPALLARVLPGYLKRFSGTGEVILTHTMLANFQKVINLPDSHEKRLIGLPDKCFFELKNGKLKLVCQEMSAAGETVLLWHWQTQKQITYKCWQLTGELLGGKHDLREAGVFCFDAALMPENLLLQPRRGGELMQVWGSVGMRRVKHILVGKARKEEIFLLGDESGEIYLLGNLRRSIHAPVTADTEKTLKITVKELA